MEVPAWHVLLVQCATFGVGAFFLWLLALKPIMRILDERRGRIVSAQREAAAAKERAGDLEAELKARLARMDSTAKRKFREVETAARKVHDQILAHARKEAGEIVARGRDEAGRERAEIEGELRRDAAKLSVEMARRVIARELTAKDRKRFLRRALEQIPRGPGGKA